VSAPGVVIAGGGLAAQRCCETLRARGFEGPVTVVCGEPVRPYDRPPLSKELLAGALSDERLHFRPQGWYAENGIDLLVGRRAARLDVDRRRLELEGGEQIPFDQLLVATGSEALKLPGTDGFSNVHVLRTLADARSLAAVLGPGARLAVIGAGFIGQEAAATARGLGAEVTVIESAEAPLEAVLGADLGRWFARLHLEEGAKVLLSAKIERFDGNGRVEEIALADGTSVACDAVLMGIGVRPSVGWLAGSRLEPNGGIPVDAAGRSREPGIFAAGDAALTLDPSTGQHVRGEHWEGAAHQGAAAARGMLGLEPRPTPPASFWSDQYGLRINYVGRAGRADTVSIDGDPTTRDFAAVFTRRGHPTAALLVGRPHALADMRRRIRESDSIRESDREQRRQPCRDTSPK
jgi:NADPH-dependent 2,4-dienoyl-CoA reductase/sulfur reductase-like enzyme